jgi:predicted dienelactone hydrolase
VLRRHLVVAAGVFVTVVVGSAAAAHTTASPARPRGPTSSPASIGLRVLRFVDKSRVAVFRDGIRRPRTLVTYVRYPRSGQPPFPLIVFGHGFALLPGVYAKLLGAWAQAGYVVAAPVFPVENEHAPGGPDESDLVNQPGDMSFVISRLLAADANRSSVLHGLIDPARVAVAGHSDGAETAFAVAYERHYVDHRVRAAVILSGAILPPDSLSVGKTPPLLAVQGTADPINPPSATYGLFGAVSRPRFLLRLLRAGHLPPYTTDERQLGLVERVTIAFLDRYLRDGSLQQLLTAAHAPGLARLTSDP